MKGMVMAGMMALSLVLGAMAVFSDTWLTSEDTEEGMTTTTNTGLSTYQQVGDMGDSDTCEATGAVMEGMVEDSESECDGSELTWTTPMSNFCEMLEDMGDESSADDCNDTASAGSMGAMGMWGGIVLALLATLMMVLPMAGIDAMDGIPEIGQKVISWGAGGLMLLGLLMWYFMLPDGDSDIGSGLLMAGAAMTIALGSTAIGQFIPENE